MTKPGVSYTGVPQHLAALRTRLANVSRDSKVPQQRLEVLIASVVATQLVSDAVVKGGIALKLRGGDRATRFTTDVDVARPAAVSIDEFIDSLRSRGKDGWAGFTARVIEARRARAPKAVPADYVMRPYELKLAYRGRSFKTVTFEVGHDEISSMASPAEWRMSPDIADLFQRLGLPEPDKVRVLPAPYQIAQKLHACTDVPADGTNDRAHDLVDILLLCELDQPEVGDIGRVARRVFASRRAHSWPPVVIAHSGWAERYADAAAGLDMPDLATAVRLVNDLIAAADAASEDG
jgi:hypothetical protein